MRILQLGCGRAKRNGAVGVDINPLSNADVICDLNSPVYPFADSQFDLVICEHVVEHLGNVIHAMEEIHRIAKPDARVEIEVPHFSSVHYYSDPTHQHPFALHSFDYFIRDTAVSQFHYSGVEYRLLRAEFPPPAGANPLKRWLFSIINQHRDWYEKHLAFIMPRHTLHYDLQVVKRDSA